MSPQLFARLSEAQQRLHDIDQLLSDPLVHNNISRSTELARERHALEALSLSFHAWQQADQDLATAKSWEQDPDMAEWAKAEEAQALARMEQMELEIKRLLVPVDPNDERNIFLEIRAGTGGNESALFSGALFRMYSRYAERMRWQVEIISSSEGEVGGYKEIIARIVGFGAYSRLKFESGAHRVQRVPETEAQGRVHTSACTVAVLAEADEVAEISINPAELRIDTFRASGAGGQHINKTDSAVRLTHLPTGLVVECQDDRSQHKNKARAMSVLAARLRERELHARQALEAATRKSLIGSGDRSERIRTYNFPQGRLTDHRINLTLYKLEAVMDGDLHETIEALTQAHQSQVLEGML